MTSGCAFRDWRTAHRIELYNCAAARALTPLVGVVGHLRVFSMVDAVTDICSDNAHLNGVEHVLDALSAAVLEATCEMEATASGPI